MHNIYENRNPPPDGPTVSRVLKVTYDKGIQVYLEGHPYPHKGMPEQGAIDAINIVKKMFLLWPLLSLNYITETAMPILQSFILTPEYMTAAARELREIIPTRLGIVIAHVIEYDNAYRFRFQHMCDAVTQIELATKPHASLKRMLNLNRQNDYLSVHNKIKKLIILLRILLLYPPFKRQWKLTILNCTYKNLQTDLGDQYWISIRTDYGPNNQHPIQ